MNQEFEIKRWTVKLKAELFKEIIKGKTSVSEAIQTYDLTSSEVKR